MWLQLTVFFYWALAAYHFCWETICRTLDSEHQCLGDHGWPSCAQMVPLSDILGVLWHWDLKCPKDVQEQEPFAGPFLPHFCAIYVDMMHGIPLLL